jgi:hypothetical protein
VLHSDDNPDIVQRDESRLIVPSQAIGKAIAKPESANHPSIATIAGDAKKVTAAWAADLFEVVADKERSRRWAICKLCGNYALQSMRLALP